VCYTLKKVSTIRKKIISLFTVTLRSKSLLLTPKKIIETFIQCIPYVGFPRVLNAITVAKKVFSEKNPKTY